MCGAMYGKWNGCQLQEVLLYLQASPLTPPATAAPPSGGHRGDDSCLRPQVYHHQRWCPRTSPGYCAPLYLIHLIFTIFSRERPLPPHPIYVDVTTTRRNVGGRRLGRVMLPLLPPSQHNLPHCYNFVINIDSGSSVWWRYTY